MWPFEDSAWCPAVALGASPCIAPGVFGPGGRKPRVARADRRAGEATSTHEEHHEEGTGRLGEVYWR